VDFVYEDNLRLSQIEYLQQRIYLRSQPRCLGLVLGNACNIYCPHCYQSKNGDSLLKPAEIGRELRREFVGLYPYLSTLRVQGGETFAFSGFRDLVDDVAATIRRPIISVSTNGTLIDERWAERIVRLPFSNVTISIDGGTRETFARLRRGADLDEVLANARRIERWKAKLASPWPVLDSFFVVMRSNFREIPQYLELMGAHGFTDIALQTIEINSRNTEREPSLVRDELITDPVEIRELHTLLLEVLPKQRLRFRMIRTSGFTTLFASQGLDGAFLREEVEGLYPNSEDLTAPDRLAGDGGTGAMPEGAGAAVPLCPNPWTTMFVAENGDVHLCFLAEPTGNLYETPARGNLELPASVSEAQRHDHGKIREVGLFIALVFLAGRQAGGHLGCGGFGGFAHRNAATRRTGVGRATTCEHWGRASADRLGAAADGGARPRHSGTRGDVHPALRNQRIGPRAGPAMHRSTGARAGF
jgi:MoaA/NifB/PqqE/SkfB family radical SAM enzyme